MGILRGSDATSFSADLPGPLVEGDEQVANEPAPDLIGQTALGVELGRRSADEHLRLVHGVHVEKNAAAAQIVLRAHRAAHPGARPHHRYRLPGEGLIGGLGFHARGGLGPEVGYWLGRPYWGLGLASEALAAAMAWAQGEWDQRCVVAHHFVDNPASGVVLVKAGFLYTGEVAPRPCRARGEDTPSRGMVWLA